MAGIYIHIPFCRLACHYCDFHFSTKLDIQRQVVNAIAGEISLQKNYFNEEVETIYFGGGTPSILTINEIQILLEAITSNFGISAQPEITLEANPDDLSQSKLADLRKLGINRLSIGIQSFDDTILKFLNRSHSSEKALQSIKLARAEGFDNISIDLIYSIPNQFKDDWKENIYEAIKLSPEHISAYSLTIEEKTAFGILQKKGQLKAMDEEPSAEQFEILMELLEQNGYEHYEISNFCKPGLFSRHNSSYWQQSNYLGVGPSAHSFNGESRQFNISNNSIYLKSIESGIIPFEIEHLSRPNKVNEYILTSIRTSKGCNLKELTNRFKYDLGLNQKEYIEYLINNDLSTIRDNHLILTKKGKLIADKIALDLFVET